MFFDESTFRLIRGKSKVVKRPLNVLRHDTQSTVKTLKHPNRVMVCVYLVVLEDEEDYISFPKMLP